MTCPRENRHLYCACAEDFRCKRFIVGSMLVGADLACEAAVFGVVFNVWDVSKMSRDGLREAGRQVQDTVTA